MTILVMLVLALVVVILTELVKRYVHVRPEAIAALFSALVIVGQSVDKGQPPDIPALLNGLYLYIAASLGWDKIVKPLTRRE